MMNSQVPIMSERVAAGHSPEIVFWVGCAGSYDARAQKVTVAFCKILNYLEIDYAILGKEEQCTGDPARRAGNEFVFQMLALQNIATLNMYEVKRIVTTCPHCFNAIKNDYPALGGNYDVVHHTQFLHAMLADDRLTLTVSDEKITYHDSCYLGRANGEYDAPRSLLESITADLAEMERSKTRGLCCGAGGAQMFKEDEAGDKRINIERVEEALDTKASTIAVNCPFCLTMMSDGVKAKERQEEVMVYDLSELIVRNKGL